MNRLDRHGTRLGASLLLLASCDSDPGGAGGTDTTATSTVSTSAGEDAASTTSAQSGAGGDTTTGMPSSGIGLPTTSQGTGGSGGDAVGGGGSGASGGAGPLPEDCWEIQDNDACIAAGCGGFEDEAEAIDVADGVCVVSGTRDVCLPASGGLTVPGLLARDFEAEGPSVYKFRSVPYGTQGWVECNDDTAPNHLACCCWYSSISDRSICDGITPLPP